MTHKNKLKIGTNKPQRKQERGEITAQQRPKPEFFLTNIS